uniref:Uncharacterized protein n=1 Tax=uncultured Caudovirales phage TaxID=2100421 RepID=A0A6J5LAJ6_9CAUD|nr:hypothetical protein UFOVP114_91 [uncultured Caudovirales phage]
MIVTGKVADLPEWAQQYIHRLEDDLFSVSKQRETLAAEVATLQKRPDLTRTQRRALTGMVQPILDDMDMEPGQYPWRQRDTLRKAITALRIAGK